MVDTAFTSTMYPGKRKQKCKRLTEPNFVKDLWFPKRRVEYKKSEWTDDKLSNPNSVKVLIVSNPCRISVWSVGRQVEKASCSYDSQGENLKWEYGTGTRARQIQVRMNGEDPREKRR